MTDEQCDYAVARLDEVQRAFGGAFARVRATLGITAFGAQVIDLPPDSGDASPEHDHLHDGQEELFVLLSGAASLALPDRAVALDAETFVRVGPATRRRLRSGPDGARVLVIGGTPGAVYTPPPNSLIDGPELMGCPTAATSLVPGSAEPRLTT